MLTVKVCHLEDLPKTIDLMSLSNNGSGKEYASYLVVESDSRIVRVESSAMEPEDVSFYRDLAWVAEAIREAYSIGLSHGKVSQ